MADKQAQQSIQIYYNRLLQLTTMKKQTKLYCLSSKLNTDKLPRNEQKSNTVNNNKERMRLKLEMMSSPNKENQHLKANIHKEFLSPVSPLQSPTHPLSPNNSSFLSPARTTPLQNFAAFRSNKGKQQLEEQLTSKILFSGLGKDGKHRVESIILQGQQLAKACEYEKKMSMASIMQGRRESEHEKALHLEQAKISHKQNGAIISYAVNTHQGVIRNYNEDRVSITLNIKKKGVKAQFFAIYDGHGGNLCCDFLKDRMHQQLINSPFFPLDPKKALAEAINQVQYQFLQQARGKRNQEGLPDKSGSCALITLLVDEVCYIANVGDSRAILSTQFGKMAFNLSRDHRPSDSKEQERILSAGGKVYRTQMTRLDLDKKNDKIVGPLRILPGKLSVSRTIGDIEAKHPQFGGMRGVVSSQADIRKFRLSGKQDFIVMCCDGILQRMESMEVVELVWKAIRQGGSVHQKAGRAVNSLLEESMKRKSTDNLTAIVLFLGELNEENSLQKKNQPKNR